jgi:hypothetical protein
MPEGVKALSVFEAHRRALKGEWRTEYSLVAVFDLFLWVSILRGSTTTPE